MWKNQIVVRITYCYRSRYVKKTEGVTTYFVHSQSSNLTLSGIFSPDCFSVSSIFPRWCDSWETKYPSRGITPVLKPFTLPPLSHARSSSSEMPLAESSSTSRSSRRSNGASLSMDLDFLNMSLAQVFSHCIRTL